MTSISHTSSSSRLFNDLRETPDRYNPAELSDDVLRDDWRIVTAWYCTTTRGGRIHGWKPEDIARTARHIVQEMEKRGFKFHPEEMKPCSRELYKLVAPPDPEQQARANDEHTPVCDTQTREENTDIAPLNPDPDRHNKGRQVTLQEILSHFKDFYIRRPAIYLIGGLPSNQETTGDIDILIDKNPDPEHDLPIIFRLYRMLPSDLWPRLHIIYNTPDGPRGPYTTYIPLYDIKIERSNTREIVQMSKIDTHNSLKPGHFFRQQKPRPARPKGEKFTVKAVLDFIETHETWRTNLQSKGIIVEPKYDGLRVQIHRGHSTVTIWTEDGTDITQRPAIQEIRKWADRSIPPMTILEGEIEAWSQRGNHMPRWVASGLVHRHEHHPSMDSVTLTFTAYDLLYQDQTDIHSLPFQERLEHLKELLKGTGDANIRLTESRTAHSLEEVRKQIEWARARPGSEGAMLKLPCSPYKLTGETSGQIKYKDEVSLDVRVTRVHRVEGTDNVWNYQAEIDSPRGPIPIGRTFNTSIRASPGQIIEVIFQDLNIHRDSKGDITRLAWVFPRVKTLREDKKNPDNLDTALEIAGQLEQEQRKNQQAGQESRQTITGDSTQADTTSTSITLDSKPTDPRYPLPEQADRYPKPYPLPDTTKRQAKEGGKTETTGKQRDIGDIFMVYPEFSNNGRPYVMQHHYRGSSVHTDLRIDLGAQLLDDPDYTMVGWTLLDEIQGLIREPVRTLEEARKLNARDIWKIDWHRGRFKNHDQIKAITPQDSPEYNSIPDDNHRTQIEAVPKTPIPRQWLTIDTVLKPASSEHHRGDWNPVMSIVDTGRVWLGAQKPYYHEYFFESDKGRRWGRLVFRLLPRPEKYRKAGAGRFWWTTIQPESQQPYVLSRRAVKKKWLPPEGQPALPPDLARETPENLRYWTPGLKQHDRLLRRLKLAAIMAEKYGWPRPTPRDHDNPREETDETEETEGQGAGRTVQWKLQRQTWKARTIVRDQPARVEYHLLFKMSNRAYIDFISTVMPASQKNWTAIPVTTRSSTRWNSQPGTISPRSKLNQTPGTPSRLEILSEGQATFQSNNPRNTMHFHFPDRDSIPPQLRGLTITFTRQTGRPGRPRQGKPKGQELWDATVKGGR